MSEVSTQALDWEQRYRAQATPWERPSLRPAFLAWRQSGELAPCRILVPGAGRSAEPGALAEAGFAVTVIDLAPSSVAWQRDRLGDTPTVIEADLFAWQPETAFDAIYDQTCLCALPVPLWPDYADRLHAWLRPGGALFMLFMQTDKPGGPPYHCDLPAMRALFPADRWDWPPVMAATVFDPLAGLGELPVRLGRR